MLKDGVVAQKLAAFVAKHPNFNTKDRTEFAWQIAAAKFELDPEDVDTKLFASEEVVVFISKVESPLGKWRDNVYSFERPPSKNLEYVKKEPK